MRSFSDPAKVFARKARWLKEPTGAREELVTDRASCRAVATSKIMLQYLHAESNPI